MYLIDTNIWLEQLLEQERSEEVRRFLQRVSTALLRLTDFSLYSIGIILTRLKRTDVLRQFLDDITDAGIQLVRLSPADLTRIIAVVEQYGLDFDDAYQYAAAEKHGLTIVSFDHDFDQTDRKAASPDAV